MLLFSLQFGLCLPEPRMPRDGSVFHMRPGGAPNGVSFLPSTSPLCGRGLLLITTRSSRLICNLKLGMYVKSNRGQCACLLMLRTERRGQPATILIVCVWRYRDRRVQYYNFLLLRMISCERHSGHTAFICSEEAICPR